VNYIQGVQVGEGSQDLPDNACNVILGLMLYLQKIMQVTSPTILHHHIETFLILVKVIDFDYGRVADTF
jgi:hypothetical protein